ncbi:MAG: hypothetical protein DYG89_50335 [Caldilinea sp. CFX5]|nr:hypothetical protein [Caldilinea sp. CFX5]
MSSATTFNAKIWERRWEAVTLTMDQMLATPPARTRQKTLENVLTALQVFGDDQINFFLDGFGRKGKAFLEPSTLYPPEYVLSATLNQIMHDLNVIGRAWEQRREGFASAIMQDTLAKADQMANQALTPAIKHELLDPALVITYFQKDTNVRIIPYAPVSFIGLPLTCQTTPRDLLAIPHEVGHYVYRYGRVGSGRYAGCRLDAALPQRYSGQAPWCAAWMEEIFADVYGGLVGGPVMALGFADLLRAAPREHFIHDDGEHPVAALRLGIYQTVFAKMKVDANVQEALQAQKAALQEEYGNPTSFITAEGDEIDLQHAEEQMAALVNLLLSNELASFRPAPLWPGNVTGADLPAALQQEFERAFATPAADPSKLADLQQPEAGLLDLQAPEGEWNGKRSKRKVGATESWIDLIKAAVRSQDAITLPPNVWMALFDGSGWATEGPGGGIAHG